MENKPSVSCICLTYGRPAKLEEAIYSFLQQDYSGPKELIILNDLAQQVLEFEHPEVWVINVPQRFRTIGEKMNAAVALATHNLLFVWDDDDIYLAHRLSFSVNKFEAKKGFFKPNQAWFLQDGQLEGPSKNRYYAASCWSRDLFDTVQGHRARGMDHDLVFEEQLEQTFPGSTKTYDIRPEEIYYIYRWGGTGSFHLSGFGHDRVGEKTGYDKVASFVAQRIKQGDLPQGRIPLKPHWKIDYQQLVSDYIKEQELNQAIPIDISS